MDVDAPVPSGSAPHSPADGMDLEVCERCVGCAGAHCAYTCPCCSIQRAHGVAATQAYISNYSSHTKVDRLLFIAERNAGKPLELEALKLAADEVKQVGNPPLSPTALGYILRHSATTLRFCSTLTWQRMQPQSGSCACVLWQRHQQLSTLLLLLLLLLLLPQTRPCTSLSVNIFPPYHLDRQLPWPADAA
jgi:hypothetical protein